MGYSARATAIDRLELEPDRSKVAALFARLEAANARALAGLRRRIRAGRASAPVLRRAFARLSTLPATLEGYDALDLLVSGLLKTEGSEIRVVLSHPEMVQYQPTPARAVLALLDQVPLGPDDVFYDLGSGLGQVVLLLSLLSPAHAKGVELEASYQAVAQRWAQDLKLPATLIQSDVREVDLSDGTVFFLYTPFTGAMLQTVQAKLKAVAAKHPLRICTYGPCTADFGRLDWLRVAGGRLPGEHELAVFTTL